MGALKGGGSEGEELRHTPDASGLLGLLEKPKLGDGAEPSCSGVARIWEECGWGRGKA